jgi:hypothetical protein
MAGSITAANAIFQLDIPDLFAAPQQLQGFAADDIFGTDDQETVQTSMGVDGLLSAGFVFVETRQRITLQADSASNDVFDQWNGAQQAALDAFPASAVVILPALRKKWQMTRGFLTSYKPIPDAGKILRPRTFTITWQRNGLAPI